MDSKKQKARLFYDTLTGEITELTLRYDPSTIMPRGCIEIDHDMGIEFLQGNLRMIDHIVTLNEHSELVVIRKDELKQIRSFWELCNAESDKSPVVILDKTKSSFSFKIANRNQRFVLYVTERNDPNILLSVINSSELDVGMDNDLSVKLSLDGDYDIYVRNHAA